MDEALEFLNIPHLREPRDVQPFWRRKAKGGAGGRACHAPSILLLDEPLASLDPASAQDTLDAVRMLADQGMSILMVEHRVEDVLRIHPERVMFMSEGEIRYLGRCGGVIKSGELSRSEIPGGRYRRTREAGPCLQWRSRFFPARQLTGGDVKRLVRFENVAFGYESEVEVLHGINLEINRGDVIAVLGPNGAGKTTFVKHAIGLLKPKSGRVLVDGRDTQEASVARDRQHAGICVSKPQPHVVCADGSRGTGVWSDQSETPEGTNRTGGERGAEDCQPF